MIERIFTFLNAIPADKVAHALGGALISALCLLSDAADADSTQMVRMEQMTPILHAAMVYRWQQK